MSGVKIYYPTIINFYTAIISVIASRLYVNIILSI